MVALTQWYLDFTEIYGNGNEGNYSYGPFEYAVENDVAVSQFVADINAQFDQRADNGPAPRYKIQAVLLGGYDDAGLLPLDNFSIRYSIRVMDRGPSGGGVQEYKIAFRNGPHGFDTPIVDLGDSGTIPRGELTIKSRPDTRLAEIPYSSHINVILDKPPVPPDFRIVPFNGVSNRLLLLLNSSTGEYLSAPVLIKETDLDAVMNQYVAQTGIPISADQARQQIEEGTLLLTYRNDDPIDRYEIFRTTTRPTSYTDFAIDEAPYKTVSGRITIDKRATGAHLIDSIAPNTKYYYCVRGIDVHNNFSNPTHVFEAEMVDNEGQIYLILKVIYFANNEKPKEVKEGRRYIYIEPSLRNLEYNVPIDPMALPSTLPGNNVLDQVTQDDAGNNIDADCWDKTLKIRVTSKKTGKKVDLNVTFKNTGVITP
jgi:hypothetical protein